MKLFFLFLFLFATTLFSSQKINIVYNDGVPPLKFTDATKNANGMLIDIWKLWAKKNNIKVKFVEASWDDTIKLVKENDNYIHAGIYYTKDRDSFLDYSSTPLYENKNYFFYYKRIQNVESIESFSPFVVGVGNGYLTTFIKENYPELLAKPYEDEISVVDDFVNGKSKVILTSMPNFMFYMKNNNVDDTNFKYGNETFAFSKKYYGAVKEGNKKLLKLINDGFENITDQELKDLEQRWTVDLNLNYLKNGKGQFLTTSQREYLRAKKEIKMCVDPQWLPFEKIENGKHVGIVADIFKEFEKTLNTPIRLIETKSWNETLEFVKEGKCEILSAAAQTKQRESYLNFTNAYLTFPQVIVTREDEEFIENFHDIKFNRIGVVKGSAITDLVTLKYPNTNLVDTHSIIDGLFKVSSGNLYGFVNTSAAVSYAMAKNGITNLKLASKVGIDYHLRVAVKKEDQVLLDIFNKLIPTLSATKLEEIKNKWLSVKVEQITDYSLIWKIVLISLFGLVVSGYIIYRVSKLKKEIEKQKKEFEKILSLIPVPVLIVSKLSKKILFANDYASKTYKIDKNDLIDEQIDIIYTMEDQRETILSKVDDQGVLINHETTYKAFDGSHIDALLSLIPIEFRDERSNLGVITDVTKLKEVQKALQKETKIAKDATNAKSDFLAKMSHEIRTPMNAILGMLYLVEKTSLNKMQENYVLKASTAAKALLNIVDDILDISKIEAGKLTLENRKFQFNNMLQEIMGVMSYRAEEKGLELLAYYDKYIPTNLISDQLRIGQILNNLISNAIKFTKEGEIVISTKLMKLEKKEATIMFCVKDSGIGIDKEYQDKLFKDFSQVDDSITRKYGGTGLGLSISKKLSDILGGNIWLEESIPNKGTTFCFTIKCAVDNEVSCEDSFFPEQLNNVKILIIDDNKIACDVLADMLYSFGFKVDIVHSGQEGYEKVADPNNNYDMVFLDYKMPQMNGIETFKKIKTIKEKSIPKVVMVTAYSNNEIILQSQQIGIDGYLIKPASPSTVFDIVIETLSSSKKESKPNVSENRYDYIDFKGVKVLLVEDNELNQDFAIELLQGVNIEVDVANDGIEALSKVKSKSYDIILMDIQMPNMDGLTATKHIRLMAKDDIYFKDLPILALSANASLEDKEKSLESGMQEHISKPINPNEIFGALSKYLDFSFKDKIEILEEQKEKWFYTSDILKAEEVIEKIGGNEDVYIKLLDKFISRYIDVDQYILKLINNGELGEAASKVHEIKGVAGNLGAYRLFDILSTLNTLLKHETVPNKDILDKFSLTLNELIKLVKKNDSKIKKSDKGFDKREILDLLYFVKDNIEDDIIESESKVDQLAPYLQNGIYKEEFKMIKEYFDEFDTDSVISEVDKLIGKIDEA